MESIQNRFLKLPKVEQIRLTNLIKWMVKGRPLDASLLRGFPKESLDILADVLAAIQKRRKDNAT